MRELLRKLRAELRMRTNLFPDLLSEREFGHGEGYIEALEWVLKTMRPDTEEEVRRRG